MRLLFGRRLLLKVSPQRSVGLALKRDELPALSAKLVQYFFNGTLAGCTEVNDLELKACHKSPFEKFIPLLGTDATGINHHEAQVIVLGYRVAFEGVAAAQPADKARTEGTLEQDQCAGEKLKLVGAFRQH